MLLLLAGCRATAPADPKPEASAPVEAGVEASVEAAPADARAPIDATDDARADARDAIAPDAPLSKALEGLLFPCMFQRVSLRLGGRGTFTIHVSVDVDPDGGPARTSAWEGDDKPREAPTGSCLAAFGAAFVAERPAARGRYAFDVTGPFGGWRVVRR